MTGESNIGSAGYPRGQCRILYIRMWSDDEFERWTNKDPTMIHVRLSDEKYLVSEAQAMVDKMGRRWDELRENEFDNPNIYSLRWYYNPEDRP